MENEAIHEALGRAIGYLTEHPDEARYTDSAAIAVLESGLTTTVSGPQNASVKTDMPQSVGGGDSAPSPGWLMRAAQASCLATLIAMRAAQQGIDLGRVEVEVTSESDDRGILGIDDSIPAGPLSSTARVRVQNQRDADTISAVLDWAARHCPVQDAISRAVPCSVEIADQ